jgi:hypothetical protein
MMETKREAPALEHFRDHLEGRVGVGVTPIMEDSTCLWGVIDVDAHEDDWHVNIPNIALKVEEFALPLVVCQSKSEGAHLYLFLKEPVSASSLQAILKEWASMLSPATRLYSKSTGKDIGPAEIEIFPKQKKLSQGQLGNWVNLPYFGGDETRRFAYNSNHRLTLAEFLDLAEKKTAGKDQLVGLKPGHPDAPPCVQQMLTHGIEMGSRNNALFSIATYFRKAGVEDIEDQLLKINYDRAIMPKPLNKTEVATIARSANKSSYLYRCNEPPLCDICDKETCRTRKFGVGDSGPQKQYDVMMFGSLKKVLTDPPRWLLEINGVETELTTEQLMDPKMVRKVALERVGILGPPMKAEDWAVVLRQKNEQRQDISAPDDAGPKVMIDALLNEFTRPVEKLASDGTPVIGRLENLMRGLPVVSRDVDTEELMVYFRGVDFITMLKRKRAEEFKGAALWAVLRSLGCSHDKIRVGGSTLQVWCKPYRPWSVSYSTPTAEVKF